MKFKNLLDFNYDSDGWINRTELRFKISPLHATADVIHNFYKLHGRNEEYQHEYGEIDLTNTRWELQRKKVKEILSFSIIDDDGFEQCVLENNVNGQRAARDNFEGTYLKKMIVQSWKEHKTWLSPPFGMSPQVSPDKKFRLCEGHSRLGFLKGLVEAGYIDLDNHLDIWILVNSN